MFHLEGPGLDVGGKENPQRSTLNSERRGSGFGGEGGPAHTTVLPRALLTFQQKNTPSTEHDPDVLKPYAGPRP